MSWRRLDKGIAVHYLVVFRNTHFSDPWCLPGNAKRSTGREKPTGLAARGFIVEAKQSPTGCLSSSEASQTERFLNRLQDSHPFTTARSHTIAWSKRNGSPARWRFKRETGRRHHGGLPRSHCLEAPRREDARLNYRCSKRWRSTRGRRSIGQPPMRGAHCRPTPRRSMHKLRWIKQVYRPIWFYRFIAYTQTHQ